MPRLTEHFLEEVRGVVPLPVHSKFLEVLHGVPELTPTELIYAARDSILPANTIEALRVNNTAYPDSDIFSPHHHTNVRGDDGQDDPRWLVIKMLAAHINHLAITAHDSLEASFIAQGLIDEFDLPINNILATETSTWGRRHLLILGINKHVKPGRSLADTLEEGRDIGGEEVCFIVPHPGARFFSLPPRDILELERYLHGIECDTTWGRRLGGFFSGTKKIYERDLAGRIHATPLINPDTHDGNPLRALTYIPKNMDPCQAIKTGQAESRIISLGGRPTVRGGLRFVTTAGIDIPPWVAANVRELVAGHLSNPVKV